ncbi:hypothetical protein BHM03_00039969, partial [Ensete ventricosum]
ACRCRPRVARGRGRFFSRARRRSVSPRREKDRGDVLYRYRPYIGTPVRTGKSNLGYKQGLTYRSKPVC